MPTPISKLPVSTNPPNTADLLPIVQSGQTKQTTLGALFSQLLGFVQSGNGAVAQSVQGKLRGLEYNLIDFLPAGYVTDGSVDYTTQLQNAINQVMANGGTLRIPVGRWKTTGVTAAWSNHAARIVGHLGDGVNGGSQIDFAGSAQGVALTVSGAAGVHPILIEDLIFYNTTANDAYGIRFRAWRVANVHRCRFDGFTHASNVAAGVWFDAKASYASVNDVSEYNYLVACYFNNCRYGVYATLAAVNDIFIDRCLFIGGTDTSVYQKYVNDGTLGATYSHRWVVRDSAFFAANASTTPDIVFESGMKQSSVTGSYFEYNGSNAKAFISYSTGNTKHTGAVIQDNWMQGLPANPGGVIEVGNMDGLIVEGNTWTVNTTGANSAFVRFLDTSVTNYCVQLPGLASGAAMPNTLRTSGGTNYTEQVVAATTRRNLSQLTCDGGTSALTLSNAGNAGIYQTFSRPNKSYIAALDINNNGGTDWTLFDNTRSVVVLQAAGATGNISAPASLTAQSGTSIPAGGTAGAGIMVSSTANFGVFFGSGAPSLSAAKGSLYLRSDGSTTNDRMYVNTNGSTTWTAVTTVA